MRKLLTKNKTFYYFILGFMLVVLLSIKIGVQSVHAVSSFSPNIKNVFVIAMENHNWSDIKGSTSAPYINNTLLPMASHAEQYYNPPNNHPSAPNYVWLEAGAAVAGHNDCAPTDSGCNSSGGHLSKLLDTAGISWREYAEGASGTNCILGFSPVDVNHVPFSYFTDVTNNNNSSSANCIAHERPFTELATDLQNNTVAGYNFITPNLIDDMHDGTIAQGDTWLSQEVPMIMNSQAYKNGGAIFITWDEGEGTDGPIGMVVLSPYAKGNGYSNTVHYDHSSTLRTMEEIFGVSPMLGGAATATDLSDLFSNSTTPPPPTPTASLTSVPTPSCGPLPIDTGVVTSTVTLDTAATYTVWSRILTPSVNSASYYLQIDNQCNVKVGGLSGLTPNVWTWVNYADGITANKITFPLEKGTHVIRMIGNTPNLGLDRIIFTSDMSCIPTGLGTNCNQIATPTATIVPSTPPVTPLPTSLTTPIASSVPLSSVPTSSLSAINTPLPTDTPAPTATPVPGTQFAVTVLLHGVGHGGDNVAPESEGNKAPIHIQRTAAIEIYNSNNELVASPTGIVTFDPPTGTYKGIIAVGRALPAGAYITKIIIAHHLNKSAVRIVSITSGEPEPIALDAASLVAGDLNGDSKLSILDFNLILNCISDLAPAKQCDPATKEVADINDDGIVDLLDLNLYFREISVQSGE